MPGSDRDGDEVEQSNGESDRIPERRRRAYNDAQVSWGREAQMNKAAEEFSKLAAALNRDLIGQQDPDELLKEVADARLMLEQLEHSLFNSDHVDAAVQEATDDLIVRLKKYRATDGFDFSGRGPDE